jgi:alpha-glucosidase
MWPGEDGEGWPSWTFSNHDAPRAVSRWAEGRDRKAFAEMAMLLLVSLRGNVFVYQGEELGLPQADVPFERLSIPRPSPTGPRPWAATAPARRSRGADAVQAGFSTVEPWLADRSAPLPLAVDAQDADPASTLHVARRLIALRRRYPVLRTGKAHFVETNTPLLIFERGEGADALLFAFNLGHDDVAWALPEGWVLADSVNLAGEGVMPPCAGVMAKRAP